MAEKKINGRVFRTSQLTAGQAIELYSEVVGFLGPAAGQLPYILFGAAEGGEEGVILKDAALLAAFGQIVNTKGAKAIRELAARVVSMAEVQRPSGDYSELDIDADFDDPTEAIAVVIFVLGEHFRPFFAGKEGNGLFGMIQKAYGLTK